MEDAHVHLLSLPGDPSASFFGVYDGHGGSAVAQYASQHLHRKIVQQLYYGKFQHRLWMHCISVQATGWP